jgi:hypothetical protein
MSNQTTETIEKTAQVVALELSKFNTEGAEQFGEMVYLFPADRARPSIWAPTWRLSNSLGTK